MASQHNEGLQAVLAFMADSGIEFDYGYDGESIILEALRRNNGSTDQVVLDMVLHGVEEFQRQYTAPVWDDKAFDSNRDNTAPSTNSSIGLSYNIQGPDETNHDPILYGSQPGAYDPSSFAAPTRPPSRANSPSVNIYSLAGEAPRSVPPPPPLPQQSGITSYNSAGPSGLPPKPEFGPANRENYDPNEWGMVTTTGSGGQPSIDAPPNARLRSHGVPGFLRCREQSSWSRHRLGTQMMILSTIPAVRNALLSIPGPPSQAAYPSQDWWKADNTPIPDIQGWNAEVHRLLAFLEEGSDRSYATADRLAKFQAGHYDDPEREFFARFVEAVAEVVGEAAAEPSETTNQGLEDTLISTVRVEIPHREEEAEYQADDQFGLLDLRFDPKTLPKPTTLYDVLDSLFYPDLALSDQDESAARLACVTHPGKVITVRLNKDSGMPPDKLEIPEVFYLDRYSESRREVVNEIWFKTLDAYKSLSVSQRQEESVKKFIRPNGEYVDRNEVADRQLKILKDRISMIENRGRWRQHLALEQERLAGKPDLPNEEAYFGNFRPTPSLTSEEAGLVRALEARIRKLEALKAKIERVLKETVENKAKEAIEEQNKLRKMLTEPSDDSKINPTLPYTLTGVATKTDVVFLRVEAKDEKQEQRWQRVSCEQPDFIVRTKPMTFSGMMAEACEESCAPLLVYAMETARQEEKKPLTPLLDKFVKADNRKLSQEVEEYYSSSAADDFNFGPHSQTHDRKRSRDINSGPVMVSPKRIQKSNSMDSMVAEDGEKDDDDYRADSGFDDDCKDDFVPPGFSQSTVPPGPSENLDNDALGSLRGMKLETGSGLEMQERPKSPLIFQPITSNSGDVEMEEIQSNEVESRKDLEMPDVQAPAEN